MAPDKLQCILAAHKEWLDSGGARGKRAVLTDADLTGADLTGAVLTDADLTGAVLRHAVLRHADLTGAVLTRAVLTGADLTGAVLTDADLTGAVLRHAVLRHAVLTGAVLTGAVLTGAVGIIDAGQDPRGYRFVGVRHTDGWRVAAGCRWFTIAEARAHWGIKNRDALARVSVIENGGAW